MSDDAQHTDALAQNLKDQTAAAYLYGSLQGTLGGNIDTAAYRTYRDQLLEECGSPHDPIESMLIELLALAFHNVGRLHVKAANISNHEAAVAYSAAATRLAGEFRRCTLALQQYRAGARSQLAVINSGEDEDSPQKKCLA